MKNTTGSIARDNTFILAIGNDSGKYYMDCYNKLIYADYSPIITTRVLGRSQDFILEIYER